MENSEIQKFLHELNNVLNSANINASLIRRMHDGVVDKDTLSRLENALRDAEKIARDFQRRALAESASGRDSALTPQPLTP